MCKWTEICIEPRDVLFFRGAKPIGGSAIGEGAHWPMPAVFHHALLSAFHRKWPEAKTKHQHIRVDENQNSSFLYGDLQTVGVFPSLGNTLYFPMPADVQCKDKEGTELTVLKPKELNREHCDLPFPLTMGLFKDGEATKAKPNSWISCRNLQQYLTGSVEKEEAVTLFDVENRPGIRMNPETGTADTGSETEGGKFYLAEYMRLRDGVSLKGFANGEALESYFANSKENEFVFGGQRGMAFLDGVRDDAKLPNFGSPSGARIKWVTLTPSIFLGGWLPGWIDHETGSILAMETEKPERGPGESRRAWRSRFEKKPVPGQLVAACIPKPIPYSGWKAHATDEEGAKPTRLCVPAGAVYYFETSSEEETARLVKFLNGKRKSDIAAEKGFGFGLCGTWDEFNKEGEQ